MPDPSGNPFADLARFVALPRLDAVVCSPDGRRLVASATALAPDGKQRRAALWELDLEGVQPARRLTRSANGDHAPAFLPNGDVVFVSARADSEAKEPLDAGGLWRLPAGGGEPEPLLVRRGGGAGGVTPPGAGASRGGGEPEPLLVRRGGVAGVVTAPAAGTIVVSADVLVGPADGDDERRKARADADVQAILHEHPVVRFWDHDVGPGDLRLLVLGDG